MEEPIYAAMENVEPDNRDQYAQLSGAPLYSDAPSDRSARAARGTLIGRDVGGYRVEARIGGGAMAAVYSGVDLRTGDVVALKILLADADDTVRERFRLEAHMVDTLDHPHIVRTLDVSPTTGADGLTFIAMELVEGQSLADLLDKVHTLNVADSCALLAPIARALTYAHSRNVVHRDVKPSNILLRRVAPGAAHAVRLTVLDDPVVPLLSDFGIARALDAPDLTTAGRTIGTPAYMSPEQCAGTREIDGRADIYSLGAVLYRCLVGRSPYSGTTTQILYAHVYDSLTIPNDALRLLSPLMVEILRRSMAKEPADRYRTAAELATDLGVGAGGPGRPSLARGTSPGGVTPLSALPYAPTAAQPAGQLVDQTMTFPDLATASAPRESLRVIIPAPSLAHSAAAQTTNAQPQSGPPVQATAPVGPQRPIVPNGSLGAQTAGARPKRTTTTTSTALSSGATPAPASGWRWRGVFVGLALAIPTFVLLALAVGALLDVGPFRFGGDNLVAASATPQLTSTITPGDQVAAAQTPAAFVPSTTAPSGADAAADAAQPATPAATSAAETTEPTASPESGSAAVAPSPTSATPEPTPSGDINAYWQDAQALFADEEWEQAAAFLTLVQRINTDFETQRVDAMLYESRLRTALQELRQGDIGAAATELEQAATLRPDNAAAQALAQSALAAAARPDDQSALNALRAALDGEGAARLGGSDPCAAADLLEVSVIVARTVPGDTASTATIDAAVDAATAVRAQCTRLRQAQNDDTTLTTLPGRLLYSTQTGAESYRIYAVGAAVGSSAVEVVADGRQPALSPADSIIAFHSTRPDVVGIAGRNLNAGGDISSHSIIFTRGVGDAVDSPPSWSGSGDRLAYASVDPTDLRSRIYTVAADGRDTPSRIAAGLAPAWSPTSDVIVYNGVDDAGQQPGLWLMRADGSDATPLTSNSADTRPVWAPDGGSIVFMSNGRSGDWDVFRLNLADGIVMQLTTESSQDGLPAISPDGQHVAFVSDRGGNWNIWVKPLDGGRTLLLAPIEGSLTNWLEHTLQWIP